MLLSYKYFMTALFNKRSQINAKIEVLKYIFEFINLDNYFEISDLYQNIDVKECENILGGVISLQYLNPLEFKKMLNSYYHFFDLELKSCLVELSIIDEIFSTNNILLDEIESQNKILLIISLLESLILDHETLTAEKIYLNIRKNYLSELLENEKVDKVKCIPFPA